MDEKEKDILEQIKRVDEKVRQGTLGSVDVSQANKSTFDAKPQEIVVWLIKMIEAASRLSAVSNFDAKFDVLESKLSKTVKTQEDVQALKSDIESLRQDINTELEKTHADIKIVRGFFTENFDLMVNIVETKGKISTIENNILSLQSRIDHLENEKQNTKSNSIAIWAVVVAIISVLGSIFTCIVSAIIPFLRQ
jgi:hypothetical protein